MGTVGRERKRVTRFFVLPDEPHVFMTLNQATGETKECADPVTLFQSLAIEAAEQVGKPIVFVCARKETPDPK